MSGKVGKSVSAMETYKQYVEQLEKLETKAEGTNDPLEDGIITQLEQIRNGWNKCVSHEVLKQQDPDLIDTQNADIEARIDKIWGLFRANPELFIKRFEESINNLNKLRQQIQPGDGRTMVSNFTVLSTIKRIGADWHSLVDLHSSFTGSLRERTKQINTRIYKLQFHGATDIIHGSPRSWGECNEEVSCRLFLRQALTNGQTPQTTKDLDKILKDSAKSKNPTLDTLVHFEKPCFEYTYSGGETSFEYRYLAGSSNAIISTVLGELRQVSDQYQLSSIGAVLKHFDSTQAIIFRKNERGSSESVTLFNSGAYSKPVPDHPFCVTYPSVQEAENFLASFHDSIHGDYSMRLYISKSQDAILEMLPDASSASSSASTVSSTTTSSSSQPFSEDRFDKAVDQLIAIQKSMKDNLPQAAQMLANLQTQIPITIGGEEHTPSAGALVLYHLKQLHTNRNPRDSRLQDPDYGIKAFQNTLGFETDSRDLEIAFIRAIIEIYLAGYKESLSKANHSLIFRYAYFLDDLALNKNCIDQTTPEMNNLRRANEAEWHQKAEEIRAKLKEKWELP